VVDDPRELRDHRRGTATNGGATQTRIVLAWCAWQIATASGVGCIGLLDRAAGQQPPDHHLHLLLLGVTGADDRFLDQVGRVFGHRQTALGRGGRTTPRATPSFKVEAAFLLTKVSSTAASSGWNRSSTSFNCRNSATNRLGQRQRCRGMGDAVSDMG